MSPELQKAQGFIYKNQFISVHEPSSCKKPEQKLGLESCEKKSLTESYFPSRSRLENIRFSPFLSVHPHKDQQCPQRQQNLPKGKLGRILSPPAAFQLCVNHRSRGDKVIGKNQELLTYTHRSAGKNPWTELTTNERTKAFWEPARGWAPGLSRMP